MKSYGEEDPTIDFVGYCEDMQAYRLFDHVTKDVLFHKDACFDENFKHSSKPSLSIDFHDGAYHVNDLILED